MRMMTQLGIGGEYCAGMSGKIKFRDDQHGPLCGVPDQAAQLILGVEAAVRRTVAMIIRRPPGLGAPASDLMQPRVRPTFEPPTLVVAEVQVQPVELVQGEQIHQVEQLRKRQEVPGDIEVDAAPAEARLVGDRDRRHAERSAVGCGAQHAGGSNWRKVWPAQFTPAEVAGA